MSEERCSELTVDTLCSVFYFLGFKGRVLFFISVLGRSMLVVFIVSGPVFINIIGPKAQY